MLQPLLNVGHNSIRAVQQLVPSLISRAWSSAMPHADAATPFVTGRALPAGLTDALLKGSSGKMTEKAVKLLHTIHDSTNYLLNL